LHFVEGTSYIGIGSRHSANELYFVSIDSREAFFRETIGGKLILVDAFGQKTNPGQIPKNSKF
jgi:hypothetical protein